MTIKILTKNEQFSVEPYEFRPGYVFVQNPSCDKYDWLVVFDEPPQHDCGTYRDGTEVLACPKERTILVTWEPVSIKNYCTAYTRQFGHLLTNRPPKAENHPHYHLGKGYFPWYTGRTYDEEKAFKAPPKTKVISANRDRMIQLQCLYLERVKGSLLPQVQELLERRIESLKAKESGHGEDSNKT